MKLTIDLPSALITLSAVGIAAVLAGAAPIQGTGTDRDVQATEDVGRRRARDLVCIQAIDGAASSPFIVPPGKILVLTGGLSSDRPDAAWSFDVGATEIGMFQYVSGSGGKAPNVAINFSSGFPVGSGETVQINTGVTGSERLLFGYLEDE